MPSSLAAFICLIFILALLRFDPAGDSETSPALWIPIAWILIVATRLPSQWIGGEVGIAERALEDGNSLDRVIFVFLIAMAVGILVSRSFKWTDFCRQNLALTALLCFALLSVTWSDFPFVAFKRWFRDLGHCLAILVVLTDRRPELAACTVLRRLGYLLVPVSLLLIKYYPEIAVQYNSWTGTAMFVGPATSKNGLGNICLVIGLFFFWDTVARWNDRRESVARRIIVVNVVFFAMAVYLLHIADSQTSRICLIIGCFVVLAAHSKTFRRNPLGLEIAIPVLICLNLVLAFCFGVDIKGAVAEAVGRNPNLTDRTLIWQVLLNAHTNPLIGTGYESFWLGRQLSWVWQQKETAGLNEAHNGYLEVYLNLGIVGLLLLGAFLVASYRNICKRLTLFTPFASLSLAVWTVVLLYNVTEAAFKWHLMWDIFLLVAISVGGYTDDEPTDLSGRDDLCLCEQNLPDLVSNNGIYKW